MTTKTKSGCQKHEVEVNAGRRKLKGILAIPGGARGIVVFAHGSGSGRMSPRNQFVAHSLQAAGLATLLIDLLEEVEADDRRYVFDVELLAERLENAADWLKWQAAARGLKLGYFGASTGAAAALIAAARRTTEVAAVVSRGGRPDLAFDYLPTVHAPTLLIVGGADEAVLELNKQAIAQLHCRKELFVVPRATHLFPEPGALEQVAKEAERWFKRYLEVDSSDELKAVGRKPK
ncbi:MAG TPA: dienelactone hydrolase family protein [Pirellulales bacterium]|nr:dienelactone hydrolase family protein [Pirellulales bacterium]